MNTKLTTDEVKVTLFRKEYAPEGLEGEMIVIFISKASWLASIEGSCWAVAKRSWKRGVPSAIFAYMLQNKITEIKQKFEIILVQS